MEPPAATTTAGIYCKACGYDLRASGEARRCPECGRVFSPDDPKTFRKRPFAAPWKRALGRWAKRFAVLLLGLVILLAGVWGWYYWGMRQEQAALAEVRARFSDPTILGGVPGRWLYERHVPGSVILQRFSQVGLYAAADADLRPLEKLSELREFGVYGPIGDAGLAPLRHCPRLRVLAIVDTRLTDAGLALLRDLPHLESLTLAAVPITDAGLEHVAHLPGLKRLRLGRMPLTGAGLVHLEKLTTLEWLDLSYTRVTDAGLVPLEKLTALKYLNLLDTQVTDAGLVHLEKLTALRFLYLSGTQVTLAGAERLKAALPGCTIYGP